MAIGVLCALLAGVFRYIDQHFHTPETFLENTATLADDSEIRERLFNGFRDEIIQLADADVVVEPPQIGGAGADDEPAFDGSDPVTQQRIERDQAIEGILLDTFDSDLYDEVFTEALRSTQTQIIRTAELESEALLRDKGEITFNMRRLYESIYPQLAANPLTAAITENVVPDDYGIFPVADRETTIDIFWNLIRNGPSWRSLTFAGAILSLIGALVLAERRPSRAIQFGGGMAGVGLVVIVLVYLIRFIVPLLAGGGSSGGPVVSTYMANLWPLVRLMIWLVALGVVLAAVGYIARLIWPDDWVYSSVSDDRGVRSIMRRRGAPEPQPQHQPAAAATQVGYPGYGPQPYGGYPPQWGQPYPGQPYPPGYAPYPVGPYAQALPQHYAGPGRPTVPVMPVNSDNNVDAPTPPAGELVPPAAPPLDNNVGDELPSDAVQIVPRIVADADPDGKAEAKADGGGSPPRAAKETVVAKPEPAAVSRDGEATASAGAKLRESSKQDGAVADQPGGAADQPAHTADAADADEWAAEPDW